MSLEGISSTGFMLLQETKRNIASTKEMITWKVEECIFIALTPQKIVDDRILLFRDFVNVDEWIIKVKCLLEIKS
jgi:hypothetical protein